MIEFLLSKEYRIVCNCKLMNLLQALTYVGKVSDFFAYVDAFLLFFICYGGINACKL